MKLAAPRLTRKNVVRFVVACAGDAADMLIPDFISMPYKLCANFYRCFCTIGLKQRIEIFQELAAVAPNDEQELVDQILASWQEQLPKGARLPDTARELARQLLVSVRQAQQAELTAQDPVDVLRQSLNRNLLAGRPPVPAAKLSSEQQAVGRLVVSSMLAGIDKPHVDAPALLPQVPGYRLMRVLGSGGYGVVYLGRHEASGELRAVKVGPLTDPGRVRKEIALAARLDSPHLVRYLDHGELDGQFWIAMEYLGGCTLADLMKQPGFRNRPSQLLLLAMQILQGLGDLHAAGLIHRDLKPANIMIDDQFRLKLIDLGLVKPVQHLDGHSSTTAGIMVGTAYYMSPEQLLADKPPTRASDLYSFGCILYEMLLGKPPHHEPTWGLVINARLNKPVNVKRKAIPYEVRTVLQRCLEKDATARYDDALAALTAFGEQVRLALRRFRHERDRRAWIAVKGRGLLETFVADYKGGPLAEATAQFCARVRAAGLAAVDTVQVGKILSAVLSAQVDVTQKEEAVARARVRLREQALRQPTDLIAYTLEQIKELETALEQARRALVDEIRRQLPDECRERPRGRVKKRRGAKPDHRPTKKAEPLPPVAVGNKLVFDLGDGVKLTMARLPAGKFWMGGGGRTAGTRRVSVDEFYLGVTPVTQEQWKAVMGTESPSHFKGDTLPVESVSWHRITRRFLTAVNKRMQTSGYVFRLPTEVEWEFACRGAPTTQAECSFDFYFEEPTNDLFASDANFDGRQPVGGWVRKLVQPKTHLQRTTPVGSYKPNRMGLYDMHGNVWEWTDSLDGSDRVVRGGSWNSSGDCCQAAFHCAEPPDHRDYALGFRLAANPARE